jgi:hypothetical protein
MMDPKDQSPLETIQQEMTKITVIKANLLRTVDSFADVTPATIRAVHHDLGQWQQQLPTWMRLVSLGLPNSPMDIKRVIYLVHLFYLSANILVARLAHQQKVVLTHPEENVELWDAVCDGVTAARTAARILHLQLIEGAIFKRCWLCV